MKKPSLNSGATPGSKSDTAQEKSAVAFREESLLQFWREHDVFKKTLATTLPDGEPKPDYIFYEGPPTANGRPGIHHVAARSFKDIILRYKTMRGLRVERKAGWDTHGLPVELQVEKQLGLKSKKEIESYGVAAFNKKSRESVWEYKDEWEKMTERMGYWLDMEHPYVTYKNSYVEALWATIARADDRGHMYRDFRVGPWCTRCGTGLSSHELNQPGAYKDVKDVTAYVKFKLEGFPNGYFLAWTTTPWTLPGNIALAVGPDIDYVEAKVGEEIYVLAKARLEALTEPYEIIAEHKGSEMVGMKYEPLYPFMADLVTADQREKLANAYQVYAADFVTTTDGTGIVHLAPMYGADDFDVATKHSLPKFHVVNEEGKYIAGANTPTLALSGRYVKEADENGKPTLAVDIIDDLAARGLLLKKENYAHSYPHCWRCDTPLLYYARTSWYFRMSKLREQMLAANAKINWEPDHIKDGRFGEWLDGIKDWAISRDRYWGTPLPIWQTADGATRVTIAGLADLKKYAKKSGNTYYVMRHGQSASNVKNVWDCKHDPENHLTEMGQDQVRTAVLQLKDIGFDVIVASPFLRTQETARIIAESLGLDPHAVVTEPRLAEWNVGDEFDGQTMDFYFSKRNAAGDRYSYEAHGGESFASVVKRTGEYLYDLEEKYAGKKVLVIGHGSTIRAAEMVAEGFSFEQLLKRDALHQNYANAEFARLDFVPLPHNENYELDFHKPYIDTIELELPATGDMPAQPLTRTPEVIDVWFDSGAMPYAQHHVLGEPVDFSPKPADYIAEGVDQTRGWFYTMHAIANMLHDEPTKAYKNVVCLGLVMDANGQKMSKSRGNVVNPWELFDKYGADVLRFWFYSVNQPGEAKNSDEKGLDEVNKKVFNLLRNVVTSYEMHADSVEPYDGERHNPFGAGMNVLDRWILGKLQELSATVASGLDDYQVLEPSRAIREFIGELSQWYIRRSRDRFKSDDATDRGQAIRTTQVVLRHLAHLMAPFTPFVAEEIFQKTRFAEDAESVHLQNWIGTSTDFDWGGVSWNDTKESMDAVCTIVTLGLEARQKANVKVRQPLAKLSVSPADMGGEVAGANLGEDYLDIIKDELNVKEVVVDAALAAGQVTLDADITQDLRDEGIVRELMRSIQDRRKAEGFSPEDRPTLAVSTDAEGERLIAAYRDEIMKKTQLADLVTDDHVDEHPDATGEEGVVFQFDLRK